MNAFKSYFKTAIFSYLLLFSFSSLSAQEIIGNESLAIEYFNEGNYEKALPIFTILFRNAPDNAMYNYYYGVSLLKNNHYETATKEALLTAVVNKTPSNVNFYLGNYFHALENWSEALDFYARYKGSNHERKALEFDKYLDLCRKKINPFKIKVPEKNVFVDTNKKPVPQPEEKNFPIPEALRSEWFSFQVNSQFTYHQIDDFRSPAAKILFTKAWLASVRNDSIVIATETLRRAHQGTNNVTTRLALVERIVDAEQQSYQLLRDREKYFEQARAKESGYWDKADANVISDFLTENTKREKAHDSLLLAKKQESEKERKAQEVQKIEELAEVLSDEPSIKEEKKKITEDGVIFKVQIGSFKDGKVTPTFKTIHSKLSKLRKIDEYTDEKKFLIFTVGNFDNYDDANTLKNQLKLEGVKGPFITAYRNGARIPLTGLVISKPGQ